MGRLLLAIAVLWSVSGIAADRSGPCAAPSEQRVRVDAVWYRHTAEGGEGGTTPTEITVRPNDTGEPRVGIFETRAAGAGPQWRATAWLATFVATLTEGELPSTREVSVAASGLIDGPSAGGLITAGLLAALTGAPVDPGATMSGTINPDGTIGPVGGLPLKVLGAAKKHKRLFGFPIGQRVAENPDKGDPVDLVELAASNGMQAREIRDVYDAYRLLTGRQLQRPVPLDASDMEIPSKADAKLRERAADNLSAAEKILAPLAPKRSSKLLAGAFADADEYVAKAKRQLREGSTADAYTTAIQAATLASAVALEDRLLADAPRGPAFVFEESKKAILAVQDELTSELRDLKALPPPGTPSELSSVLRAYSTFAQARAYLAHAASELQEFADLVNGKRAPPKEWGAVAGLPAGPARDQMLSMLLAQKLVSPLMTATAASLMGGAAMDTLAVAGNGEPEIHVSAARETELARMYAGLAEANLDFFERVLVDEAASRQGVSTAVMKAALARSDLDYDLALENAALASTALDSPGAVPPMFAMASALRSFIGSSLRVASWYSLDVKEEAGRAASVGNMRALSNMLDAAELKAREQAAVAKRVTGVVPLEAAISYQRARSSRDGDLDDKLAALKDFWFSSAASQIAVLMARP